MLSLSSSSGILRSLAMLGCFIAPPILQQRLIERGASLSAALSDCSRYSNVLLIKSEMIRNREIGFFDPLWYWQDESLTDGNECSTEDLYLINLSPRLCIILFLLSLLTAGCTPWSRPRHRSPDPGRGPPPAPGPRTSRPCRKNGNIKLFCIIN